MGGRRHGLRCVTAPALDFGILTETKDSETGTVESSFTVTSAYTAEDFVSDTRSAFLACVTEDFGEQVASEAASLVDGQIASMSWYRRFEIWNDLASYDYAALRTPIISSMGSRSFPSRSPMAARSTQTVETPSSMLFTGPSGKVATESYLCLPDVLIDIIETGASGNRSSFLIWAGTSTVPAQ